MEFLFHVLNFRQHFFTFGALCFTKMLVSKLPSFKHFRALHPKHFFFYTFYLRLLVKLNDGCKQRHLVVEINRHLKHIAFPTYRHLFCLTISISMFKMWHRSQLHHIQSLRKPFLNHILNCTHWNFLSFTRAGQRFLTSSFCFSQNFISNFRWSQCC